MREILDLRESLAAYSVDREAKKALGLTSHVIAQLNVEQLSEGLTSEGKKISPKYRSKEYAMMKSGMNPLPGLGNPDLILTGRFTSSFDVDVSSDEFEVTADDIHDLEEKYSEDIYGLAESQQDYYTHEVFFEAFAGSFTDQTGIEL